MLDSRSLADFAVQLSDTAGDPDLVQRLGLYRVFLKLYEHHRGLLDEILDLENNSGQLHKRTVQYVQAVVSQHQVYLVTNLMQGKTVSLLQPQHIWVIGRYHQAAISIADKRLSRSHAAIQYDPETLGFYLIDLKSTNGSFVNGEAVRHCVQLKDGDTVRLGSLTFHFFSCRSAHTLDRLPSPIVEQVEHARQSATGQLSPYDSLALLERGSHMPLPAKLKETTMFLKQS